MTTQLAPDRLALPPPLDLDLVDAGRAAGWIADNAVGFRGFGDETEAAHAAWVAHRDGCAPTRSHARDAARSGRHRAAGDSTDRAQRDDPRKRPTDRSSR